MDNKLLYDLRFKAFVAGFNAGIKRDDERITVAELWNEFNVKEASVQISKMIKTFVNEDKTKYITDVLDKIQNMEGLEEL